MVIKEGFMKMKVAAVTLVLCIFGIVNLCCVSNSAEPPRLDTKAAGTWAGYIIPIKISPINFNGAKIYLKIASADSTFHMAARDTTQQLSEVIKDTILVLDGSWSLTAAPDSIALLCSCCRVVDTSTHTLYDRPVEDRRIPLPLNIFNQDNVTIWEISFSDLAPLVPLLGLSIPDAQQGLLKGFKIDLQKIQ